MSRRSTFASLCSLVFLVNLARIGFAPLLEPLKAAFGVGDATVGLVATLAWAGSAAPRLPTGWLLTRFRRHHVVAGAGAVLTGAATFAAATTSVGGLFVAAFALGRASGVYFVAANPLVSELFPDRVGSALGVHGFASQLAAGVAAPVVGLALALGSWRLTFRGLAVAAALATLVLVAVARRTDLPDAGAADRDLLGAARAEWRVVLAGVAFAGTVGLVWNGVSNFYVTYGLSKGLTGAAARELLTVVLAAGLPAFLVSGRLADRLPKVPYLLALSAGIAGALAALATASDYLGLLAASAALGLLVHALFPAMDAYVLSSVPDARRGSAYAVFSGTAMLAMAWGSVAVGSLREAGVPLGTTFRAGAVAVAAVALGLVALYRRGALPVPERPPVEPAD